MAALEHTRQCSQGSSPERGHSHAAHSCLHCLVVCIAWLQGQQQRGQVAEHMPLLLLLC
jgi:hypothetical protein